MIIATGGCGCDDKIVTNGRDDNCDKMVVFVMIIVTRWWSL